MDERINESVFASFQSLFLDFNWRRLRFWAIFTALIFVAFLVWENWTGHFYLQSLDKKIAMLKDLKELSDGGISADPQLGPIYQEAVSRVAAQKVSPVSEVVSLNLITLNDVLHFLGGAALGLLILVVSLRSRNLEPPARNRNVIGAAVWALMWGIIAVWIPTIFHPIFNFVALTVVQVLIVLFLGNRSTTRLVRNQPQAG